MWSPTRSRGAACARGHSSFAGPGLDPARQRRVHDSLFILVARRDPAPHHFSSSAALCVGATARPEPSTALYPHSHQATQREAPCFRERNSAQPQANVGRQIAAAPEGGTAATAPSFRAPSPHENLLSAQPPSDSSESDPAGARSKWAGGGGRAPEEGGRRRRDEEGRRRNGGGGGGAARCSK